MKAGQSKWMSLMEAWANVLLGYFVAVGSQIIIFPWFNIHIPMKDNFIMGLWFTVISIIRSYFVRRLFNLIFIKGECAISKWR